MSDSSNRTGSTTPTLSQTGIGTVGFPGVYTVRVTNAEGASTLSNGASVIVNKTNQTINFPAIADQLATAIPFSINATASSGFPVTFSVFSGPATITGNIVTLSGAGPVTIRATQAGDVNTNAATADRNFNVTKVPATVTFSDLSQIYNGTAKTPSITTSPSGLIVNVTYNGSSTLPVNAGTYLVLGTVSNSFYSGSASDTLVIDKASASVNLSGLSAVYDGTLKSSSASTVPANLTVNITYNGSTSAPTKPGSYAVVATVSNPNYSGSANGSLEIATMEKALGADGYAAVVTGGNGQAPTTVTTAAAFKAQVESSGAATITISGALNLTALSPSGLVNVASNKTIQGLDADATIIGNLTLGSGVSNVAIRGLNITNPAGDGITLGGASNVFITHCTLFDCSGFLININSLSSYVTVSWNELYYTAAQIGHRCPVQIYSVKANGGTGLTAPMFVSLHHNWWSTGSDQCLPEVNYDGAYVHLYSNYYSLTGNRV